MRNIFSVKKHGQCEIIEKKSRFISNVFPVKTKEEAENKLNEIRKEYWDASHNVFAYRLENNISKYSDDGEPQGTSGLPVFNVVEGKELINILVVISRYFGGTLLGKGGLVRAYSKAAKQGIEEAEVYEILEIEEIVVVSEYFVKDKILAFLNKNKLEYNVEYDDKVTFSIRIRKDGIEKTEKELIKITEGKISTKIVSK